VLVLWAGVLNRAPNQPAMPLSFARFPLAVHPSGVLAKDGQLYVIVTGSSTAILAIAPALAADLATVGGHGIGVRWAAIVWALGRVYAFAADVDSMTVANYIANAAKLGEFTDALCEHARKSALLSERRPAQLRVLLRRVAIDSGRVFVLERADFIDIATLLPPSAAPAAAPAAENPFTPSGSGGSGGAVPKWVEPEAAGLLTYGQLTALHLGAYELSVGGRIDAFARGGSGNMAAVFHMVLTSALKSVVKPGLLGALAVPDWIDDASQAAEFARAFGAAQPPEQLEALHAGVLEARRRLAMALETDHQDRLTMENIRLAIDHHPPLIPILGGEHFCTAAAADAWTGVRAFAVKLGVKAADPVVGDLAVLAAKLSFLTPRFTDEETQATPPAERVAKALDLMEAREEDRVRSKEPLGETRLVGYPLTYQAELYKMLANPADMALFAEVQRMIDESEHAHAIIAKIIMSGNPVLYHALAGLKDDVPALPVVKAIAENCATTARRSWVSLASSSSCPSRSSSSAGRVISLRSTGRGARGAREA
jgi:hypothetical protein